VNALVRAALAAVTVFLSIYSGASAAVYSQRAPLTGHQWDTLREQVNLLDKVAYLPSLLPVIMKHRDALELTDAQLSAFRQWRRLHYPHMVDLMNEIIQRRIGLSKASLNQNVAGDQLLVDQKAIFTLQEELLRLRLSCRDLLITTFSPIQWDNFAFILEEYPPYAGLLDE
jgi:hypothetical protein